MSWIGRFANVFRRGRLDAEIEEELASHILEAIERGRSPEEARRAFGGMLVQRERSRDVRMLGWLDSLASDVAFGWRQIRKRPAVSAAAILSLVLAIGLMVGVAAGLACGRFVASLLFEVKASDPGAIAAPIIALVPAAVVATAHPAMRAVRIDPAETLRSE